MTSSCKGARNCLNSRLLRATCRLKQTQKHARTANPMPERLFTASQAHSGSPARLKRSGSRHSSSSKTVLPLQPALLLPLLAPEGAGAAGACGAGASAAGVGSSGDGSPGAEAEPPAGMAVSGSVAFGAVAFSAAGPSSRLKPCCRRANLAEPDRNAVPAAAANASSNWLRSPFAQRSRANGGGGHQPKALRAMSPHTRDSKPSRWQRREGHGVSANSA
mmetsp:Transcript_27908/g.84261  ORF Transcript_27908/g.84261 Transcript_27908/m.84261 type:complete len:219 (+) Transcript_27908:274-930(+)